MSVGDGRRSVICIASSIDTSTVSGTPVRDARRHAVAAPSARERAGDVLAEPPADGQRRQVHVPVRRQAAAARLQHLFGELEPVVGAAVTERVIETVTSGSRCRRRDAGFADDHDVGRARATASRSARVALRRAQVGEQRIVADRRAVNTTSAPRSVSSLAQYAPAIPSVQSTTRSPS